MLVKFFLFVPCILNGVYIVMNVIIFLRHQYLSI